MSINKKGLVVDENIDRVAKLPEEYVTAVENVVDNLDDDWKNKLVYSKYITYLCDVFEDAVGKGLKVEDVIGSDYKAYADKIQKELNYMDVEPTAQNKIINYMLVLDFIMYIGMTLFGLGAKNLVNAQTIDFVFAGLGLAVLLVCVVLKLLKVKSVNGIIVLPIIQCIFMIIIMIVLDYETSANVIALGVNLVTDYLILVKKQK